MKLITVSLEPNSDLPVRLKSDDGLQVASTTLSGGLEMLARMQAVREARASDS